MTVGVPPPVGAGERAEIRRLQSPSRLLEAPSGPPGVYQATRPDVMLWAVAGMFATYVWRLHLFVGFLIPLHPAIVATAIAGLAWMAAPDPRRAFGRFAGEPVAKLYWAMVAVMVLSVPFGIFPGQSFAYLKNSYLSYFIFVVLVAASVRTLRDVRFLLLALLVEGLAYAMRSSRTPVGPSGRLGNLTSYDANDVAMMLVCMLPIAVYVLQGRMKMWLRLLGIAGLGAMMLIIVRSGSRGGFLGLIAVLLYILFQFKGVPVRVRFFATTVGVSLLLLFATDKYWELMNSILHPQDDYNWVGNSEGGRMEVWKRGIGYMVHHPAFGVGVMNFGFAEGKSDFNQQRVEEGKGYIWAQPHNSFVQAGAETGILGLTVFVLMLGTSFITLRRYAKANARATGPPGEAASIATALAGSFVGFSVSGFFLTQQHSPLLLALLALTIGFTKVTGAGRTAAKRSSAGTTRLSARAVHQPG